MLSALGVGWTLSPEEREELLEPLWREAFRKLGLQMQKYLDATEEEPNG